MSKNLDENSRFHEHKACVCLPYDVWRTVFFIFLFLFPCLFSPVKDLTEDGAGLRRKEWIYLKETRLVYVAGNAGSLIALFTKEAITTSKGIRAYMNGHLHGVLVQAMIPGSDFFKNVFFFASTSCHSLIIVLSGLNNMGGKHSGKRFYGIFFFYQHLVADKKGARATRTPTGNS